MKSLKESIFDDVDNIVSNDPLMHKTIEQFLTDNYEIDGTYAINKDNTVDVNGSVYVKQRNISNPLISLVNKLFRFGNVSVNFDCRFQAKLASLKGAPEKVGGDFACFNCINLISLKGAPKKVGGDFYCKRGSIQFTKEDVKKVCNVKGEIFV